MPRQISIESPNPPPDSSIELIGRVVAWHNRHPLARRIGAPQVRGVGVVALPFEPQTAGRPPQAQFSENFITPLKPAAIARLAWRHGSLQRPGKDDWPQRNIPVDPKLGASETEIRFLRTASIESGSRRIRVLIGDGERPRIIGSRIWHRQRLLGLLAFVAMLAGSGAGSFGWWPAVGSVSIASAGSAVVTNAPRAGPPTPLVVALPAESPTPAAADDVPPALPAPVAAEPGETAPVEVAPSKPTEAAAPDAEKKTAAVRQAADAASAAADGPVYALATRSTGSRMASELRISFMNLPTEPAADRPHAEVMRAGNRWRVVIWPLDSRAGAESLRKALAEQGFTTELIGF